MSELIARTITSGTVCIEDGLKAKEEFAPARKVKIELSFAVPDGQDGTAFLNGVASIAESKLQELLGRAPKTATTVVASVTPAKPAEPAKAETAAQKKAREKREAAEAADAAPKALEKTKADLAREAGLPTDDELLEDEPEIAANGKTVEPEEDELGDLLGDAAPTPITDIELGKAAQEKNAKMKSEHGEKWAPSKIRDLITKFAGAGKRINDIPADKRADFIKKLEALAV